MNNPFFNSPIYGIDWTKALVKCEIRTSSWSNKVRQNLKDINERLTSDEKTIASTIDSYGFNKDRDTVLSNAITQSIVIGYIANTIYLALFFNNSYPITILSLGSGNCALEYLLCSYLPSGSKIIATDYDKYLLSKAKGFFPELDVRFFDFRNDKLDVVFPKEKIDMILSIASTHVLADIEFIDFIGCIKSKGVKVIIDVVVDFFADHSLAQLERNKEYNDKVTFSESIETIKDGKPLFVTQNPGVKKTILTGFLRSVGYYLQIYSDGGAKSISASNPIAKQYASILTCDFRKDNEING